MKFLKWKILVITCIVCLLPIILGIAMWDNLPDSMAIHFNINNVADNFAPKPIVLLGFPFMMVLFQIICCVINDINANKRGQNVKFEMISKWIVPVMSVVLQITTIGYSLGWNLDIRRIATSLVGVIFIVIGIYLPKLDYVKNMKVSAQKAKKINKFIGISMVIMGVLSLVSILLPPIFAIVWLFLVIICSILCMVYAKIVGSKK
ncbi:MAG: DUF1648 domain-containing protein [Clostridia bacterium]|nr:DUF1648 domain-containing protein [Clostridia bacterium]